MSCLTNAFEALVAPVERCIVKCTRPDTFARFYALRWRRRVVAIVLIGALLAICAPIHRFAVMFVAFLFAIAFAIDYFWRRLVAPFVPEGVKCAPRTNAGKPVRELGAKIAYYIIILVAFSAFARPPSLMSPDPHPWIVVAYSVCGLVVIVGAVLWVFDWAHAVLWDCVCCGPALSASRDERPVHAITDADREAQLGPAAARRSKAARARKKLRRTRVRAACVLLASLCVFASGLVIGFQSPPPLVRVEVPLLRLPACMDGLTIGLVADVHVGVCAGTADVAAIVAQLNDADPDIVALVGDITEGKPEHVAAALEPLRDLKALARNAVFFVTGNHEYIGGDVEGWMRFYARDLGARYLNDTYVDVRAASLVEPGAARAPRFPACAGNNASFDVAGVNDYNFAAADMEAVVAGRDRTRELVLLAHQPKQIMEAREAGVGLMLSGHVHGGQIFPIHAVTMFAGYGPAFAGLHRFYNYGRYCMMCSRNDGPSLGPGDGRITWVYTSEGAVGWGPRVRFLSSPETTLVTLRAAPPDGEGTPGPIYHEILEQRMGDAVATASVWMVAFTALTVLTADYFNAKYVFAQESKKKKKSKKKKDDGDGGDVEVGDPVARAELEYRNAMAELRELSGSPWDGPRPGAPPLVLFSQGVQDHMGGPISVEQRAAFIEVAQEDIVDLSLEESKLEPPPTVHVALRSEPPGPEPLPGEIVVLL